MTSTNCSIDERSNMLNDVRHLEKLALTMGFQHEDIILFDNLTHEETNNALVYGS